MSPARKRVTSGVPFEQSVGYSRAVAAGEFIFVSGCTSISHGKVVYEGDLARQTEQALLNVSAALEQFGASLADVVQTRIYLTDISSWEEVGEAGAELLERRAHVQQRLLGLPGDVALVDDLAVGDRGAPADEDEVARRHRPAVADDLLERHARRHPPPRRAHAATAASAASRVKAPA